MKPSRRWMAALVVLTSFAAVVTTVALLLAAPALAAEGSAVAVDPGVLRWGLRPLRRPQASRPSARATRLHRSARRLSARWPRSRNSSDACW